MKYLLIFLVLLFAANFAFGQKDEYAIRIKGERLIVKHQGKAHRLALEDKIDAAKITDAEILFASRKDGFTYLVIDVSGQSKEKQDDRQCGAGIEANLIWIKLDAAWQISNVNSVRYESCWSGVMSNDSYQINGNILTIDVDDVRERLSFKLSYNADEPEKGFLRKSKRF